jgi:glyoxylase-like metal-dependent hydrolase (beta-lactamase superfamily II)
MMELRPGLHAVGGWGLTHSWDSTVYLIKTPGNNILIDTGSPLGREAIIARLADEGLTPADINLVLLTHGHLDHAGNVGLFENAQVACHFKERRAVTTGDPILTATCFYPGQTFEPFWPGRYLYDSETLHFEGVRIEVYHTPGHTPGSVCFVVEIDGERIFIGGDTLGGNFMHGVSDYSSWNTSLTRLPRLECDWTTEGHDYALKDASHLNGLQLELFPSPWTKFVLPAPVVAIPDLPPHSDLIAG